MDSVQQRFMNHLHKQGITLDDRQLQQFDQYAAILADWNERMNLSGITEREQVYEKHFYDSLSLAFYIPMGDVDTVADIGSGAGFPGIPLKIAFPHIKLTIVDSLQKRIGFLSHLVDVLILENVQLVHGRAEDAARNVELRDRFDLVTARAVSKLNVLNELCLPFVKPNGAFAAMKGAEPAEEINEAERSTRELKGKLRNTHALTLPEEGSQRHIIIIDKLSKTPSTYPRKAGIPSKQPIV